MKRWLTALTVLCAMGAGMISTVLPEQAHADCNGGWNWELTE
jgi:hypothetical protein